MPGKGSHVDVWQTRRPRRTYVRRRRTVSWTREMRATRALGGGKRRGGVRRRSFWKGEGKTERNAPMREHSTRANEELLLFFFQMDVGTRLQRALNNEQYEVAKQLRARRDQIDEAMEQLLETKGSRSKNRTDVNDVAAEGLRLRTELQRCIDEERYEDAAKARDRLKEVESALRTVSEASRSYEETEYGFTLGQVVYHRDAGYRGVVCGMDPNCCESEAWMESADRASWTRGPEQPFYLVLADTTFWESDTETIVVAYVPEEKLRIPVVEEETKTVDHPYTYLLFLGPDGRGDFVPSRRLRERYNVARKDIYVDGEDEDEDSSDDPDPGTDDEPDAPSN